MNTRPLRLAVAGYVDHGKSTVIGRLLNDTSQVKEDRLDKVKAFCAGRRFEYAFLLDALEEEQQQNITIDVTEVPWRFRDREYTIIDTPGHKEFLKNMVGGASKADAALLVVDAQEGLKGHFRRQVAVMALLGIPKIIVALNKMDLVGWSEQVFRDREQQLEKMFKSAGLKPAQVIPLAAWQGANLLESSAEMPWYRGPSLAAALADLPPPKSALLSAMRFPLQDVYKFDDKRIYVGRVESGTIEAGQKIKFLPSNRESVVKTIEVHGEPGRKKAVAGESIGITLNDPLFLERGELGFEPAKPPKVSRTITADLFWLAPVPLRPGKSYALRCGGAELQAQVDAIESVLNADDLSQIQGRELESGGMGRVKFTLDKALAHDFFKDCENTGRFVLVEDYRVAGGGRILPDGRAFLSNETSQVTAVERAGRFGHKGLVVWGTGLSGAGKSTIMRELERRLFNEGMNVFMLDGDNIRQGISGDLGFSRGDRGENIRRVAEVAKLMAESGLIVLTAFISPFENDRKRAREIVGPERFVEIFVDCPLEECEKRDPKKLYSKARSGEFGEMTGITSPFEAPPAPDLVLRTDQLPVSDCVVRLRELVLGLARPS